MEGRIVDDLSLVATAAQDHNMRLSEVPGVRKNARSDRGIRVEEGGFSAYY